MTSVSKPIADSYWVIPGQLLAGKYPGGRTLAEANERGLGALLAAGFDTFLDLTMPGELPPYVDYLPADALYLRKPIVDHGVPENPAHMADIMAALDEALVAGRRVYVHCRAGIGRTGTVIGCHLVEQGNSGEQALSKLNSLWLQNPRSEMWPEVPETEEQRRFVAQWERFADPTRAPQAMDAARGLRERFHGALVGLALGDALAAHTQFRKPGSFAPVGDLLGGGPFDVPRGAWTDDTAMALTLAESLLASNGFDARDQVSRYTRWQREGHNTATGQCVGISANVARALSMAHYKRQPFAGSHDPEQREKDPLSRVAPVVMYFFASGPTAIAQASEAARVTAQAPVVLDCVRLLAAMVHQALSGCEKPEILRPPRALWASANTRPEVLALSDGITAKNAADITGGGHVVQALEAATWAFHRSASFREGALLVANLGRDSDVAGAVFGQIAGAHYGVTSIPGIWRNSLIKRELVADTADQLLAHALVTLGN
jgi:ADP-ribosylglycohydrolase